jgi:PKD repeat protein
MQIYLVTRLFFFNFVSHHFHNFLIINKFHNNMKKMYRFIGISLLMIFAVVTYGQHKNATQPTKENASQIDTRIDNMRYWKKKASEGVIPYSPVIPYKPAKVKGSQISAKGIKTTNSPDVPVTSATNVTETECSIFIDPNDNQYVLNSNNSTSWSGGSVGSLYGANYFQSANGGLTWGGTPNGAGGSNSGDPTTAISRDGRQFVNFISSSSGQGIAYSDNGTTWNTATVAPNPGSLADKNHMWIDNSLTSPYEGNLYVAWTPFGGSDDAEIVISRSTNDGLSWSSPLNISSAIAAGSHNQGVNIQTGPNGEVYAAWAVYDSWPSDETAIALAKSTNGGASFATASRIITNIRGIRTTETSKNHRVNSFPSMAVDISGGPNNGNIYIVWANVGVPGTNTGTNISVYMSKSTNGGSSWSTPVRVNQNPYTEGKEAYFPWISCDSETGVLSVVFYDDRNTTASSCEAFTAYSLDAGDTWTDFQVSDVSFTPSPIPGLAGGYMGDYLSITSKGGVVYPCWADNRGGLYMTYVSPYELGLNASFSADDTEICTGSAVTFTDNSTGSPISWNWSFPGGSPSSYVGQNPPPVTYASVGNYTVSLTVSDGTENDTETKTDYITVKNVIADFSGTPTTVVVGNTVSFTELSSCSPTSFNWSFPGGTPATFVGQNPPSIQYDTEGTYDVSLTVTNGSGSDTKTITDYITVVPPEFNMTNGTISTCMGNFYDSGGPAANYGNGEDFTLTFYPSSPESFVRMTFNSFSTESGYDYLYIYDGENTSASLIGTYNGTTSPGIVTASNAAGALTFRFTSDGSVTAAGWSASISCYSTTQPPVADFTASTTNPALNADVVFTDASQNLPSSWTWSFTPNNVVFVNSTNANSQNPNVQFTAEGTYTVSLIATNSYGTDTETKVNYITVVPFTYCDASGGGADEHISRVQLGAIDNSSGQDYYADYTNLSTELDPGSSYDITITNGEIWSTDDLGIWIDWNQDGDFDDTDENVVCSVDNGADGTYTFSVPTNVLPGSTRMRIRIKYSISDCGSPCGTTSWGEVEDYSVFVTGGGIQLGLSVMLEGPFNGVNMNSDLNSLLPVNQPFNAAPWNYTGTENVAAIPNPNIVEWVLIELRDATAPNLATGATVIDRQAGFLMNDGQVVDIAENPVLDFEGSISDGLFVVVYQRNHIAVISNTALSVSGGVYSYDFSSGENQAYGGINGHGEIAPGVWGMYAGDGDANGSVGTNDKNVIWSNEAATKGYLQGDYNMDVQVDNKDKNDSWLPNGGKGTYVPN